ncbi:hypothetical protein M433DRAFT_223684 [Acidomyces richmondensis BFW]|nr:MAG: hypothetical protein FE78DRAFT_373418 [Acidomyces sp. 'richmondensis']KYG46091.1 hypothetical protein M433DRAFT_223684 [Acidomyces richmondensis BFW]
MKSFEALENTNSITVNSKDLTIESSEVFAGTKSLLCESELAYDKKAQTVSVQLNDPLRVGERATLIHKFSGKLTRDLAGFYISTFTDKDGSKHDLAVTQFEPEDARKAFPCFDDPALKATFDVSLVAEEHLTCLSNMDVKSTELVESDGKKKKKVTFNTTPPMSTYIVAFSVGEYSMIETDAFHVPVRVFCTPNEDVEKCRFALDLTARTLEFFENEFDIPYPLPKMDLVGIADMMGAMENWGLVIAGEQMVILDQGVSGAESKQLIVEMVQHELAHQWFGNLVTMRAWDGLWLNESFATWMSLYAMSTFFPKWEIWQRTGTTEMQDALDFDSRRSSHPIQLSHAATDPNELFDDISYQKGGCVLRMISEFIGEKEFVEGVGLYLQKNKYGSTEIEDLWAALSERSGKDVKRMADVWTKKIGYPVIMVTESDMEAEIHVEQHRFLITGDVKPEEDETVWPVDLRLRMNGGVRNLMLTSRKETFKLPSDHFKPFKLNSGNIGLYRTCYTPQHLEKLIQAAVNGHLPIDDRVSLISDTCALAAAGYYKTTALLTLLKDLGAVEENYFVWKQICSCLNLLEATWIFESTESRQGLQAFARQLTSRIAHKIGWTIQPTDEVIEQEFKTLAFRNAALAGDGNAQQAARDMFAKFRDGNRTAIDPNLRYAVFATVLATASGQEEYDAILHEYRLTSNSQEFRDIALATLGRSKSPELISRTLDLMLSKDTRVQDVRRPMPALRSHPAGVIALWEWMKANWDTLKEKLQNSIAGLRLELEHATKGLTTTSQAADVENFFQNKSKDRISQTLGQSLDGIKGRAMWVGRDSKDVKEWLEANGYIRK